LKNGRLKLWFQGGIATKPGQFGGIVPAKNRILYEGFTTGFIGVDSLPWGVFEEVTIVILEIVFLLNV
jgi:hypothetical protein